MIFLNKTIDFPKIYYYNISTDKQNNIEMISRLYREINLKINFNKRRNHYGKNHRQGYRKS